MAKGKSGMFSSFLESLGFSQRKPRGRAKQRPLKLEPLENRRLLTASVDLAKGYTITDDGSHLFEGPTTPTSAQIAAAKESGTTVTVTTSAAHGFSAGESVSISGVTKSGYNGTFTIATAPTSTTFTYTDTAGLGTTTVAAGATATASYLGDIMNYTITVTNADGQGTEADNVVITDDLAPQDDMTTLISGTVAASSPQLANVPQPTVNASSLLTFEGSGANGFVLPAGDSVTITYQARVNTGVYYTVNTANGTYVDPTQAGTQNMVPATVAAEAIPGTNTPLVNLVVQQPQSYATANQNGASVTYEVIIGNNGPSNATGVAIYDPSAAGELSINSWSVIGNLTGSVGAGGSVTPITPNTGGLDITDPNTALPVTSGSCDPSVGFEELVDVPQKTQIAFQVVGTIDPSVPGGSQVVNDAFTTGSPNDVDTTSTTNFVNNPWDSYTTLPAPSSPVNVSITKTAYAGAVTPGGGSSISALYTITVTNNDASSSDIAANVTVSNITLTDGLASLPLSNLTWSAQVTADPYNLDPISSPGTTNNGDYLGPSSGSIDQTLALSPGEQLTYTISGTVNANAETVATLVAGVPTLSNTATLTMPTGYSDSQPTTATAAVTLSPSIGLTVTKTDNVGANPVTPGNAVTYTIAVSNSGPSDATNVDVTDALGAGTKASGATWTESPGTASGTGALNATVADLAPGVVTFTEIVPIDPATTLTSTTDTASATSSDMTGSVSSSPVTVNIGSPAATLTVNKTDGYNTTTAPAVPGATLTYTVTVSNQGPSDATNVQLTDAVDASVNSSSVVWTTGASPTSGLTYDLGSLAAGTKATVYVLAGVYSNATGSTTDTVSATADDMTGSASSSPVTVTLSPQADLGVTKTDNLGGNSTNGGIGEVTPGGPITYTIAVTNNGPSDVSGATVTDNLPSQVNGGDLLSVVTTGSASSGATLGSIASDNFSDTANLPAGSSITYVISATVSSSANVSEFTNTATAAVPNGVTDPVSTNNSATVTDGLPCDLSVTKTDTAGGSSAGTVGNAVPGSNITYTITVSNAGPATATGATVSDTLPAVLTGLKLVSASDGTARLTGGTLSDTVTLAKNASVTYLVSGAIPSSATGQLSNVATATPPSGTPDSNLLNNTATDVDNLTPTGDLSITKKDNDGGNSATSTIGSAMPGTNITYTIVANNSGPSDVTGATISDAFPAAFAVSSVTGTATANASGAKPTGFTASGTANIGDTVNMPAGTSITYVVAGKINSASTGSLANTASIAPPTSGFTDSNSSDNSATVTDTLVPTADLQITKSDNMGGNSATGAIGNTPPGSSITYTIKVTNAGPSDASGVTVSDALPTAMLGNLDLLSVTPTGSATSGAATGALTNLSDTVNLPAGTSVTYVISATVSSTATGTLTNVATLGVPNGVTDPNLNNNSATDTDTLTKADLVLTVSGQKTAVAGHDVIYQVNVTNYGPGVAQGVVITDTLPAGTTFVSATSSNAAMLPVATTVNANGTTTVTFTASAMGIGAAATSAEAIVIDAMVKSNVTTGTVLTNKVAVTTPTAQAANAGHSPVGSASFTTQVNTNGASLVPSMLSPGKMDLVITNGPAVQNTVLVVPSGGSDVVLIDGRMIGSYLPTGRIVIYGDSNDYEWVSPSIKLSAWLYGGSGTNYLYGGGGNDVILGGPAINYISGGAGRNLLIGDGGGSHPNYIMGTTGDNIEISGSTSYNANAAALNAILQEWDGGDSYNTRVQKLTQTGLNVGGSTVVLNTSTIQRAAAYEYLYGGLGQNFYFATQTGSQFDRDYVIGRKTTGATPETLLPS